MAMRLSQREFDLARIWRTRTGPVLKSIEVLSQFPYWKVFEDDRKIPGGKPSFWALRRARSPLRNRVVQTDGLSQSRMGTARVLLAERNVTVGEVANSLGYESEAAFNHAFKRHVGMSPGGVRRAH